VSDIAIAINFSKDLLIAPPSELLPPTPLGKVGGETRRKPASNVIKKKSQHFELPSSYQCNNKLP
jgi:hypothetical protein